ncbi:prediced GPI-anchored protein 23 [Biomphalaria pfeifferi]|uniref:Prediced GPI-anchored protein 23 n=1 Tax=Biomphalaria pfeifferi TaxID=112525 RepID=A0AAD8F0G7_BIOPF|nr:prediced GPI-anchored protein 23 [Biomphalaria pfeifferi]
MTVIIAGAAGSIATSGLLSGSLVGATVGLGIGLGFQITGTAGTAAGIAGAVAASASGGSILGIAMGKELNSVLVSGAMAMASGYVASAQHVIHSGPVGWLLLGADVNSSPTATCTFDCWKPVVHDHSVEPSAGKLLRDVVMDPRIKQVTMVPTLKSSCPQIFITNVWNEQFRVDYVTLPNKLTAAHAVLI